MKLKVPMKDKVFMVEFQYHSLHEVSIINYYLDPIAKKPQVLAGELFSILGVDDNEIVRYLYICKQYRYFERVRSEVHNVINPMKKEEYRNLLGEYIGQK